MMSNNKRVLFINYLLRAGESIKELVLLFSSYTIATDWADRVENGPQSGVLTGDLVDLERN